MIFNIWQYSVDSQTCVTYFRICRHIWRFSVHPSLNLWKTRLTKSTCWHACKIRGQQLIWKHMACTNGDVGWVLRGVAATNINLHFCIYRCLVTSTHCWSEDLSKQNGFQVSFSGVSDLSRHVGFVNVRLLLNLVVQIKLILIMIRKGKQE